MHKPYFPNGIMGQRAWLVNYKAQIAVAGAAVGLTPAQITAEQNSCQAMIVEIDATDAILIAGVAKVAERNSMIKAQMAILRSAINALKNNTGYTQTIGEQLDVIGTEITVDTAAVKTTVKLAEAPSGVDIKFTLEHCDAGSVYSMRGTETVFTFLKTVIHPHTIDTRPNLIAGSPEARQYYVTLVVNDAEVGIPSAPETINI
ncbi:MAG: hypothetical protein ACXVPY_15855 [Bacteroidia bacterium]